MSGLTWQAIAVVAIAVVLALNVLEVRWAARNGDHIPARNFRLVVLTLLLAATATWLAWSLLTTTTW